MQTTVEAYFLIFGFECSPELITKKINITPYNAWVKGDLIGKSIRRYEYNGWRLKSSLSPNSTPEEHLNWFLNQLPNNLDCFNGIGGEIEAEFSFSIIVEDDEIPEINFCSKSIKSLSFLNAGIDVDICGINE